MCLPSLTILKGDLDGESMDGSEFLQRRRRDWRCRGRTVAGACGVDAVGPWLGPAERAEISTAGLSIAGRYTLVACKHLLDRERDRICDAALLYLARDHRRPVSRRIFCVRTVSDTRWNLGQTTWFTGHPETLPCCGKSLIRRVSVGFDVRQHTRPESISKRAPSSAWARA